MLSWRRFVERSRRCTDPVSPHAGRPPSAARGPHAAHDSSHVPGELLVHGRLLREWLLTQLRQRAGDSTRTPRPRAALGRPRQPSVVLPAHRRRTLFPQQTTSNLTDASYQGAVTYATAAVPGQRTNVLADNAQYTQAFGVPVKSPMMHRAKLTGLLCNTLYTYAVGDGNGHDSTTLSFTTAPPVGPTAYPVNFIAYADMGISNSENTVRLGARAARADGRPRTQSSEEEREARHCGRSLGLTAPPAPPVRGTVLTTTSSPSRSILRARAPFARAHAPPPSRPPPPLQALMVADFIAAGNASFVVHAGDIAYADNRASIGNGESRVGRRACGDGAPENTSSPLSAPRSARAQAPSTRRCLTSSTRRSRRTRRSCRT